MTDASTSDAASSDPVQPGDPARPAAPAWLVWAERAVAAIALAAVAWVLATAGGAVAHGHPLYVVLLGVTVVGAGLGLALSWRRRASRGGWRRVLRIAAVVAALGWVATLAWLRPFPAVAPALDAMASDGSVTVTESATRIVMTPVDEPVTREVGVLCQPGARVDARAYAAHLRPLAEAGHTVVIVKQPLGIAFLAMDAYESARYDIPAAGGWVVAGHSLGGTVAAIEAGSTFEAGVEEPVGLLLWGSYPAGDVSSFPGAAASISGENDGLSTPADIEASRAKLPDGTVFVEVPGAAHAQFGSYGAQPGDGEPTASDSEAREAIVEATLAFLESLDG